MLDDTEATKPDSAITTSRLTLRRPTLADFGDMTTLWSEPEVIRYIGGHPFSPEEVWQRLLRYRGHWALLGYGYWAIRETAANAFVGEVGFADWHRTGLPDITGMPEGGWVLNPSMQGKGYAGEALDAALAWLDRTIDPPSSACIIAPENRRSLNLAQRRGYRIVREATYRDTETCILVRDSPTGERYSTSPIAK
ncbi:GNAT family N-acetyltransferase [Sphingomonas adhaesiva]|uniref:GNAT family N-acetyltransferase n=1 Tax=Sphingomonas adhaesiva TaxID=28212 RepID=UPI002FFA3D20